MLLCFGSEQPPPLLHPPCVRCKSGDWRYGTDTNSVTSALPVLDPKMCQAEAHVRDISPDSSRLHRFIHLHIDILRTHTTHSIYVSTCSFVRLLHTALTPSSPGAPEAYSSSVLSSTQCFATDTCACVCVCLSVCMHKRMHVCMRACMYACMHVRTYVRIHAIVLSLCVCVHARAFVCVFACWRQCFASQTCTYAYE